MTSSIVGVTCRFGSSSSSHKYRKEDSSKQHTKKKRYPPSSTKKKRGVPPVPSAAAGRVVQYEDNWRRKKKKRSSYVCPGCGSQILQNGGGGMSGGRQAEEDQASMSKRQQQKMRYMDVMDDTNSKNTPLCSRCRALQEANSSNHVPDGGSTTSLAPTNHSIFRAYDALRDIEPAVFMEQLQHLLSRRRFGLCVLVLDATDSEHSAVPHLRKLIIGKLPLIVVWNKVDLMPRFSQYDRRTLERKVKLNTPPSYAVSAKTGRGMNELAEGLLSTLGGKDVFVVGSANVGKSTLVQSLSKLISESQIWLQGGGKSAERRRLQTSSGLQVTESHLPGTTLQAIRIPCFSSPKHALWDTPGIINPRAVQYSLFPSHLMEPLTRPGRIDIPSSTTSGTTSGADAGGGGKSVASLQPGWSVLIESTWMTIKDDMDETPRFSSNDDDAEDDDFDYNDDDFRDALEETIALQDLFPDDVDVIIDPPAQSNVGNIGQHQLSLPDESTKQQKQDRQHSFYRTKTNQHKEEHNEEIVLGRIDLIDMDESSISSSIHARSYLHPSLRMRIVRTSQAPDTATIPARYIEHIQQRIRNATGGRSSDDNSAGLKKTYSLPLQTFTPERGNGRPEGHYETGASDYNQTRDKFFVDIVFASLGWISFTDSRPYTLMPHCVQGSVFSKRKSLYPANLCDYPFLYQEEAKDDVGDDVVSKRLQQAARMGRKAGGVKNTGVRHGHRRSDDDVAAANEFKNINYW